MNVRRSAVFLDRDGTLNRALPAADGTRPPHSVEEFELLPGVEEGCRALRAAGHLLVVVTNQPDVGRGDLSLSSAEAINARLVRLLPIDRVEVCYDSGRGEPSEFRKPAPGMLLKAAADLGLDLSLCWMVGDRWRDVDCGRNAGVRTIFIETGRAEPLRARPDFVVRDFTAAVSVILGT